LSSETRESLRDSRHIYNNQQINKQYKELGDSWIKDYEKSKKGNPISMSFCRPHWNSTEVFPLDEAINAYQKAGDQVGETNTLKKEIDYFKNSLAEFKWLGFTRSEQVQEIIQRLNSDNINKYGLKTAARLAQKKLALGILRGINTELERDKENQKVWRKNPYIGDSEGQPPGEKVIIPDIEYIRNQYANALEFAKSAKLPDLVNDIQQKYKNFEDGIKNNKYIEKMVRTGSTKDHKDHDLLQKIFGSALILVSGGLIFSLAKGPTSFAIAGSDVSSKFSIVLIIVSLMTGFWLWFKK